MGRPPEWPHRCPQCGRYLSKVEAFLADSRVPVVVMGVCKEHGQTNCTSPLSYDPNLWEEPDE